MSLEFKRTKSGVEFSMKVDAMTATWSIDGDAAEMEIVGALRSLLSFYDQHAPNQERAAAARIEAALTSAIPAPPVRKERAPESVPDGYELIPEEEMNGWRTTG